MGTPRRSIFVTLALSVLAGCAARVPFDSQARPRGVATATETERAALEVVLRAVDAHGQPHRWSSLILSRAAAGVDAAPAVPDDEYLLHLPERWLGTDVLLRDLGTRRFEGKAHRALRVTGRAPAGGGGEYLALFDSDSGRLAHLFVATGWGAAAHAAYQGWRRVGDRWQPGRVVLEQGRILEPAIRAAAR